MAQNSIGADNLVVRSRRADERLAVDLHDELGYLPFSQAGGALLFHLLSRLYEHTSVMITTPYAARGIGQSGSSS